MPRTNTYTAPAAGEDAGALISSHIQTALHDRSRELVLGAGEWVCQTEIEWPRESVRVLGQGYPGAGGGTVITRSQDICILPMRGVPSTEYPVDMVQRPQLENILFDGRGFSQPIVSMVSVYEARLLSVHWEGWYVTHLYTENVWDSRFEDCSWVGGGFNNPAKPLTTDLEQRAGYPIGVPMVHLHSPNTNGSDTSNNLYFRGCRWESSPNNAVTLLADGGNAIDLWFSQCKWEAKESMVPLVLAFDQSGVMFDTCWIFGAGGGAAPYDMDGCAAGTKYKTIMTKHPGLIHALGCEHIGGKLMGGGPDHGHNENAPFDSFIRLEGGAAAELSMMVTGGLTRLEQGNGAVIRYSGGLRYSDLLAARASLWAESQAPEVPMVDDVF
jgi:hypothetical protein